MKKKPGLFKRFGRAMAAFRGEVPNMAPPIVDIAGVNVSERSALTLSAAWACVRLISETIATLPLSIYERTSNGKQLATSHRLHAVLHDQPNPDTTAAVHWEACVAAMLLRGNAFCEKLMFGDKVVGLQFLSPNRLQVWQDSNGAKFKYQTRQGIRDIPAERIWHVPGLALTEPLACR